MSGSAFALMAAALHGDPNHASRALLLVTGGAPVPVSVIVDQRPTNLQNGSAGTATTADILRADAKPLKGWSLQFLSAAEGGGPLAGTTYRIDSVQGLDPETWRCGVTLVRSE